MVLDSAGLLNCSLWLPDASDVCLIGQFNNWSTATTPLKQVQPGLWELAIRLPAGQHQLFYHAFLGPWRPGQALRTWISDEFVVEVPPAKAFRTRESDNQQRGSWFSGSGSAAKAHLRGGLARTASLPCA